MYDYHIIEIEEINTVTQTQSGSVNDDESPLGENRSKGQSNLASSGNG
jgi:hypothetical protein